MLDQMTGKDQDAWDSGEGVCYISDGDEGFTRAHFEEMVARFAAENGLTVKDQARRLFDLVEYQHPQTVLDEDERDHCLWRDEEWPGYTARKREQDMLTFGLSRLYPQAMEHLEREMARHGLVYSISIEAFTNYGHLRCVESVEMQHSGNPDNAQYRCEQLSAAMQRMNSAIRHLYKIVQLYTGANYYVVTFDSVFTEPGGGTFQTGKFQWNTHDERIDKLYAHYFQYERIAQFFWLLHERLDELAAERNPWPAK